MDRFVTSLASIYSDKLDKDTRTPVYIFSVPGVSGEFGILGFPLAFWVQLATVRMLSRNSSNLKRKTTSLV